MSFRLAALLGFLVSACAPPSDQGLAPATPERIQEVCDDWSVTLCGKRDECGSDDLNVCISSAKSQCVYDANAEEAGCQAARLAAMESCAEQLGEMTCEEWCDDGFCYLPCPYVCTGTN
jgi:hypothetical protein